MTMTKEEWLHRQKFQFLLLLDEDPYTWAVDKAYLTFCRVLSGYTKWEKENRSDEKTPKERARDLLINALTKYCAGETVSKEDFQKWHKALSKEMRECYEKFEISKKKGNSTEPIRFTYGCAQKWINMALKFLYSLNDFADYLGAPKNKADFRFCHIPLDRYVIENATAVLNIQPQWEKSWSQLDDYEQYMVYERQLIELAEKNGVIPLDLDFALWVKNDFAKAKDKLNMLGITP